MPGKITLKPSVQSLNARGLPTNFRGGFPRTAVSQLSSESETEKRINSMTHGLDRCSSLLNALLNQSEGTQDKSLKKKRKRQVHIVSPKKIKSKTDKIRDAPFNKRLPTSTPVSRCTKSNKKKTPENVVRLDSDVLCKDDMMSVNTIDELIEQRDQLKGYLKQVTQQKAKIEAEYDEIVLSSQSPNRNQLKLPEEETCNSTVHREQSTDRDIIEWSERKTSNLNNHGQYSSHQFITPEKPFEINDTSPNHDLLETLMKSISEKLSLTDGTYLENHSPQNEICSSARQSVTEPQKLKTQNLTIDPYKSILKKSISPKTPDKFHISQQHDEITRSVMNKQVTGRNEHSNMDSMPSTTHLGSTQIVTLKYLLKDLYGMLNDKRDLELDRLLQEIDHVVETLPFVFDNNTGTNGEEIEVLKMDNIDLKRKLQLEKQSNLSLKNKNKHEIDVAIANLKNEVDKKEKALMGEQNRKSQLLHRIDEVKKVTCDLKSENQRILNKVSELDMKHLEDKQQWLKEKSKLSKELSCVKDELAESMISMQACDKENNILKITSQQQNSEIQRLTSLNKDLQASISTLLADIEAQRSQQLMSQKLKTFTMQGQKRFPGKNPYQKQNSSVYPDKTVVPVILEESERSKSGTTNSSTISSILSSNITDSSVSTLKTFDNIDFQNDLIHLDAKIDLVRDTLVKQKNAKRISR